jgi:hypothetical protein
MNQAFQENELNLSVLERTYQKSKHIEINYSRASPTTTGNQTSRIHTFQFFQVKSWNMGIFFTVLNCKIWKIISILELKETNPFHTDKSLKDQINAYNAFKWGKSSPYLKSTLNEKFAWVFSDKWSGLKIHIFSWLCVDIEL